MSKKWRLTERTRTLLTIELAIVLPAAALMAFSIWNLNHIQRDKAIEAAIQRDFTYVLKIAEKKSLERANDILAPIRNEYPGPEDGEKIKVQLDRILADHPELSFALLYDKKTNMVVSRMQTNGDNDPDFCARAQEVMDDVQSWLPLESTMMAHNLRMMEKKGDHSPSYFGEWLVKGDHHTYNNGAYFIPPDVASDRVTLGVVSFDEGYLKKDFFPAVMRDVLTSKSAMLRADMNPPAMMIHPSRDSSPMVASANWDGANRKSSGLSLIFFRA